MSDEKIKKIHEEEEKQMVPINGTLRKSVSSSSSLSSISSCIENKEDIFTPPIRLERRRSLNKKYSRSISYLTNQNVELLRVRLKKNLETISHTHQMLRSRSRNAVITAAATAESTTVVNKEIENCKIETKPEKSLVKNMISDEQNPKEKKIEIKKPSSQGGFDQKDVRNVEKENKLPEADKDKAPRKEEKDVKTTKSIPVPSPVLAPSSTKPDDPNKKEKKLKKLRETILKRFKWVQEKTKPGTITYFIWTIIVCIVITYNIIVIPLRSCFLYLDEQLREDFTSTLIFFILDVIGDGILFLDMIFCFTKPFRGKDGVLVFNILSTIKNYLLGWFLPDFVSLISADYIIIFIRPDWGAFFRINRCLKFFRAYAYLTDLEIYVNISTSIVRILRFSLVTLVITHILACIYNIIIHIEEPVVGDAWSLAPVSEYNTFEMYLFGHFFAISNMVGFGDVFPYTLIQSIYSQIMLVIGILLNVILFGTVSALVKNLDATSSQTKQKLDEVMQYMKYRNIPMELREKILNYYAFLSRTRRGWDEEKILEDLPTYLRIEVAMNMNRALIEKVPLFQGVNRMFIASVVLRLTPRVCLPKTIIVEKGEMGREMFFIASGYVEVVSDDHSIVFATLQEGKFFGEIALIYDTRRNATVRAGSYCELFILTKESFEDIEKDFPDQVQMIKREAEKRKMQTNSKK